VLVGNGGDLADVDQREGGVRGRLDPDQLGVGADQLSNVDLDAGAEGDLDVVCEGDLCEVAVGSAVDVGDGDDVGASGERLEDVGCGGGTRAEGERIAGVLERSDGALKVVTGGCLAHNSRNGANAWETYRLGFEERAYSYSPTGFPTSVCAKVVEREICTD
jgi:hypothetical protein